MYPLKNILNHFNKKGVSKKQTIRRSRKKKSAFCGNGPIKKSKILGQRMPKKFDPTDFEAVVWGGACPLPPTAGKKAEKPQKKKKREKKRKRKKKKK